jgi:AraC family transcriptional regulator
MDKFLLINAIITFIETRIKGEIDYGELAYTTGFSLAYIRELFACQMNKSLYRYILERKIANAAFECRYTDKTLLSIGMEYGFNNADAFTRAFKRIVGVTPSEFRKMKSVIKRRKLCAGVYGIELPVVNDER